jgi:uncharacterized membrane protein YphA (DoxX/SURF4 family)
MVTTSATDPGMFGSGLLIARVVLGSLMVAHGGQKLFGWLDGLASLAFRRPAAARSA